MNGESAPATIIFDLASRQHTVLARWQLRERDVPGSFIDSWLRSKRLVIVHRGVYALGHLQLSRPGWWMAAVLAGGPDTVLSHKHAAAHWQLMPDPGGCIHV